MWANVSYVCLCPSSCCHVPQGGRVSSHAQRCNTWALGWGTQLLLQLLTFTIQVSFDLFGHTGSVQARSGWMKSCLVAMAMDDGLFTVDSRKPLLLPSPLPEGKFSSAAVPICLIGISPTYPLPSPSGGANIGLPHCSPVIWLDPLVSIT